MASRSRQSMGIINLVPHPGSIRPDCLDEPVRNHSLEEPITQEPFSRGSWVIGFNKAKDGRRISLSHPAIARLLNVDLSAGVFELLLEVSSFSLGNSFLDRLRSAFNEVLGFLQAEAGDAANFLDDVDLVGASVNQDNVEFSLFFFRCSSGSSATLTCADVRLAASCSG